MTRLELQVSPGVNWQTLRVLNARRRRIRQQKRWWNPFSWGRWTAFESEAAFVQRAIDEARKVWNSGKYAGVRLYDVMITQCGDWEAIPYQNGYIYNCGNLDEKPWVMKNNPMGCVVLLFGIALAIVAWQLWR